MVRFPRFLILGAVALVLGCGRGGGQGADDAAFTGDLADAGDAAAAEDPGADATADPDVPAVADLPDEVPAQDPGEPGDPGPADVPGEVAYDIPPDAPIGQCCYGLGACGEGMKCVAVAGEFRGTCLPLPAQGDCWSGTDCAPGQVCLGSVVCACDDGTEGLGCDIPGHCEAAVAGCCDSDGDCLAFQVCAPGNTCQDAPAVGRCWRDGDCGMGQTCEGVVTCGCDVVCGAPSMPGSCAPLPSACCYADADCGEGLVCRGALAGIGDPGTCVPAPTGPQCTGDVACCWDDADCPGGKCAGAIRCGCIDLCPMCGACQPDQMGTCASYAIDVDLVLGQSGCDLGDSAGAFSRFFVALSWTTSIASKSQVEFALNAFYGTAPASPVEEGYVTDHAAVQYFSHMFFGAAPKAGEKLLIRVRATAEDGKEGLSDPVEVTLDTTAAACLYPYDKACSDGGPVTCRAIPGPCDADKVLAARDGCLQCVHPATCTCDDGSPLECDMVPPECGWDTLAVQDGCYACVSPMTCKPLVR